jgi:hypothetical protein
MRFLMMLALVVAAVVGCLFLGLLLFLRMGPTGPVPTVDPVVTLNQQHAAVTDNAAELYVQAFEACVEPPSKSWLNNDVDWDEESAAIAEWLDANAEAIKLARAAVERDECWLKLRRSGPAFLDVLPEMSQMRWLIRLFRLRADLAARNSDWDLVVESLETMDGISRHTLQQPSFISHLVGISGLALEASQIRRYLALPTLTETGRRELLERVDFAFRPPPSPKMALSTDRDLLCWQLSRDTPPVIVPAARVAGEVDRYFGPFIKLAGLSAEEMLDPDHALRLEVDKLQKWRPSLKNPIRSLVSGMVPATERMLLLHGRLLTEQRGTRVLVAVLRYEAQHQTLPESLDALGADLPIDPFTGERFIYRRTDDGFTLYSAGMDRDDDGGVHSERFGEQRAPAPGAPQPAPDGDYVFWPVPE